MLAVLLGFKQEKAKTINVLKFEAGSSTSCLSIPAPEG